MSACYHGYTISNATIPVKGKYVLLPEVDKILTDYCSRIGRDVYTVKFIEIVNQQYPSSDSVVANGKLEYAVNLYEKNCNLTSTSQLAEVRSVLSACLKSPFDLFDQYDVDTLLNAGTAANLFKSKNQDNLPGLTASRETKTKKFLDDIANLNIPNQKPPVKIGSDFAKWVIDWANTEIENDLKYHFAMVSLNAAALSNADEIINDERFRASAIDPKWNEYDETIKKEVAYYNQKFSGKNDGFAPLDWRWVKAMLWTEVLAGPKGDPDQWTRLPMQIGKFTQDLGYVTVKEAKQDEGADLIVEDELKEKVQIKANVVGHLNVRAGIAYLYIRYVDGVKTDDEVAAPILTTTVLKGEFGFEAIANRLKTTTSNNIKINNPEVDSKKLKVGQEIKYQQARAVRSVSKWKDLMEATRIYNIGDTEYVTKVKRAYLIITSRTQK